MNENGRILLEFAKRNDLRRTLTSNISPVIVQHGYVHNEKIYTLIRNQEKLEEVLTEMKSITFLSRIKIT